jgi:hypothetical protein
LLLSPWLRTRQAEEVRETILSFASSCLSFFVIIHLVRLSERSEKLNLSFSTARRFRQWFNRFEASQLIQAETQIRPALSMGMARNIETGGVAMEKSDANPIDLAQRLRDAPRCHAKAKSTGERCNAPAVRGWAVCRVHGAGGGAPSGEAHWNWKHGARSSEMVELRRLTNELARIARFDGPKQC